MASALSTSINLVWDQPQGADAVDYYEIRYNFTINECNEDTDHNYRTMLVNVRNSSSRSYSLANGPDTPVEEDSIYYFTLVAVNSKVRSDVVCLVTSTLQAGTIDFTCLLSELINSFIFQLLWANQRVFHQTSIQLAYRSHGVKLIAHSEMVTSLTII